ncbi:MAG: hypothetical protein V3U57_09275, partial [Robiginitomaculum sp.]
ILRETQNGKEVSLRYVVYGYIRSREYSTPQAARNETLKKIQHDEVDQYIATRNNVIIIYSMGNCAPCLELKSMLTLNHNLLEDCPVYFCVLNPIEQKWAQAKSIYRKYRCSIEQLFSKHTI